MVKLKILGDTILILKNLALNNHVHCDRPVLNLSKCSVWRETSTSPVERMIVYWKENLVRNLPSVWACRRPVLYMKS